MPPVGEALGAAGLEVAVRLREYAPRTGQGRAFPDGVGFAVAVRSENDYGLAAEEKMQDKRADYFACGTLVVWDVWQSVSRMCIISRLFRLANALSVLYPRDGEEKRLLDDMLQAVPR